MGEATIDSQGKYEGQIEMGIDLARRGFSKTYWGETEGATILGKE